EEQLSGNIRALVSAIHKARPSGAKGAYVQRIAISSTMGPGLKLDVTGLEA
ncbi:MAG: 50S ribosomal protein L1, partial [Pseudomonadota bacterium]|nr:50S ribosomal protein L1 [Pseudomonadota bacterium]